MLEVLNSPDIRKHVAPVSIDRYHRMIELGVFDEWPVELLDGVLVEKISNSDLHIYLVQLLHQMLNSYCGESGSARVVGKEDPITIGNSEPEPDLSVVRGSLSDFRKAKPTTAELVIEVAISSLALDRAKASDYANADISEYWIVRPEDGVTEVYTKPLAGEYSGKKEVPAGTVLESVSLPGFCFDLERALAE